MILHIYVKKKRVNVLQSTEPERQGSKEGPREMHGAPREGGNRSNVLVPVGAGWHWNLTDWLIGMDGGGEC